jgi:excisionase family DNA binding protein
LERLGILTRRFFRTNDWIARIGDDSIAVLLPETSLDQASSLAERFRDTVHQRLALHDYKTGAVMEVAVSCAAVGTDLVQSGMDGGYVLSEAEAAVIRAKQDGHHRVERVALQPTSVTIFGAASLLGRTPREITALMRSGTLPYTRRGRHFHIDRAAVDRLASP